MSSTSLPTLSLPGQDELPCDDGMPMETERHHRQMDLLIETLDPWLAHRGSGYVGGNMFVYFSSAQARGEYFRGPDVFVVLDVPRGERKSWVVWDEGKGPDVVIELLSGSTARADRNEKKQIYESQLKVAEYFWFDPFEPQDWAGFRLDPHYYQAIALDQRLGLFSRGLGLYLTRWTGSYRGIHATWLRWSTHEGILLPTDAEQTAAIATRADQAESRADQAESRADQAESRAKRLAAKLRALGVDPDDPD